MNEALKQYEIDGNQSPIKYVEIIDYLAFATGHQGNLKHAIELNKIILKLQPDHPRAERNIFHYKQTMDKEIKKMRGDTDNLEFRDPNKFQNERPMDHLEGDRETYEYLCREDIQVLLFFMFLKAEIVKHFTFFSSSRVTVGSNVDTLVTVHFF